jgi:hypothetical protein
MRAISLASPTSIHARPHVSILMHRGIASLYSTFSIQIYLDMSSINVREISTEQEQGLRVSS